jgi:hypothetical protein
MAGELLAGMEMNKVTKLKSDKVQLSDMGITKTQSSR